MRRIRGRYRINRRRKLEGMKRVVAAFVVEEWRTKEMVVYFNVFVFSFN